MVFRYHASMNTPRYEYSRSKLTERINKMTELDSPFGLMVRFAVKANPHPEVISTMDGAGIHFDASSSYEASELLAARISGEKISLSSQQSPHNLETLLEAGVRFVATSLNQLEMFLSTPNRPDTVGVRINPDMGHGHNKRTSTGGVAASFGIWHEYIPEVLELTNAPGVTVDRLHLHVGSGANPKVWAEVMDRSLEMAEHFPDVTALDIGGGYKVHRFGAEEETDIAEVLKVFNQKLKSFEAKTGRGLKLEIEPGTFLVAHIGTLVATIDDIVDTGADGFKFIKLNTGMNDFLRTTMYGAQHKIEVINDSEEREDYVVVGHNCESGDIFTTKPGDPEELEVRRLNKARIGDEVRIHDTGAYCASMRASGYNSFPEAIEVFVD